MQVRTLAYGLPRLGPNREYKSLLEGFWGGRMDREAFLQGLESLEALRLAAYGAHVDFYPVGEMSLYDPLLDLAVMVGVYPVDPQDIEAYYRLPLRKWFVQRTGRPSGSPLPRGPLRPGGGRRTGGLRRPHPSPPHPRGNPGSSPGLCPTHPPSPPLGQPRLRAQDPALGGGGRGPGPAGPMGGKGC
jgi:5-methyltetrahydropteroyltriglutamate--homocysteine methyltransferase